MKVLIFSDLHGKLTNVKHYLSETGASFDHYFFAGDFMGYLPIDQEVIDFFFNVDEPKQNIHYVLGNHDLYFIKQHAPKYYDVILLPEIPKQTREKINTKEYNQKYGLLKTSCLFEKSLIDKLQKKPAFSNFDFLGPNNIHIKMIHGSPWDNYFEYIYPDFTNFNVIFKELSFDILIMGHTHKPYIKQQGGRYIINPGSVTLPRGKLAQPSFIICKIGEKISLEIIYLKQKIKYKNISPSHIEIVK